MECTIQHTLNYTEHASLNNNNNRAECYHGDYSFLLHVLCCHVECLDFTFDVSDLEHPDTGYCSTGTPVHVTHFSFTPSDSYIIAIACTGTHALSSHLCSLNQFLPSRHTCNFHIIGVFDIPALLQVLRPLQTFHFSPCCISPALVNCKVILVERTELQ